MNVGDVVRWSSQAGGYRKTKEGTIIEVVSPGLTPVQHRPKNGVGLLGRNHESYVVQVQGKFYWPRVSLLTKVG